jgi:haloalkane dehalogenase
MIIESFPPRLPEPVRALYPFRTRCLLIDESPAVERPASGVLMSFADEGPESAPPLLLLHGNLTWSFLYRDLIARARSRFRVIAPDLLGFGLSSKPRDPAGYTLERYGRHLSQLVSELRVNKLTLVLHDWAGPIGFRYAMACPENVSRIVLVNSWPNERAAGFAAHFPLWLAAAGNRWAARVLRQWTLTPWPDLEWATAKPLEAMVEEGYRYPFRRPASRTAPLVLARLMRPGRQGQLQALESLKPELKKIRAKVQVLWGERNPLLPGKLLPYLLRDWLPNCGEPVFVSGASHLLPEDTPQLLAEKVLETAAGRRTEPMFKIL